MSNELLDVYDENENFLETLPRDLVHEKGLWHKTTHCWLVKKPNILMFQMRAKTLNDNPGKLYTTASGHVAAGESLKDALKREVQEELGANIDTKKAELIHKGKYKADFITKNGKEFHDRALYHIFLLETDKSLNEFNFQDEELEGVFELPVNETLDIIKTEDGSVKVLGSYKENNEVKTKEFLISINDFLVLNHETPYEKFGLILEEAKKYLERA